MHLKNQPPVFVPSIYCEEIEKLSKAALMDMVWDLATRCSGADDIDGPKVMAEVRHTAEIITLHRKQARAA